MTNALDDHISLVTIGEIFKKLGDDPTHILDAANAVLDVLDARSETRIDDLAILSLAIANAVEAQVEFKNLHTPIITAMNAVATMLLDDRRAQDEKLVDDVCHCPTCGTELVPDEPEPDPGVCEYCGAAFEEIDPHCEGNFG